MSGAGIPFALSASEGVGFNFCCSSKYSAENILFCSCTARVKYASVIKSSNERVRNMSIDLSNVEKNFLLLFHFARLLLLIILFCLNFFYLV